MTSILLKHLLSPHSVPLSWFKKTRLLTMVWHRLRTKDLYSLLEWRSHQFPTELPFSLVFPITIFKIYLWEYEKFLWTCISWSSSFYSPICNPFHQCFRQSFVFQAINVSIPNYLKCNLQMISQIICVQKWSILILLACLLLFVS